MSTVADDLLAEQGRSRRRVGPAVIAAVVLAAVMGWVWWSFFALKEDQTYRVLFSAGTVDTGTVVQGAQALAAGQRLSTGDDGFIAVRLSDGTVARLMPNTTLDIEDARASASGDSFSTSLRLLSGEIESRVERDDGAERDVSVFSKSIAIGVRGTVFTVQEDGAQARLMVTRGRVEASAQQGDAAAVDAGQGTTVSAGGALGAISALPEPPTRLERPRSADGGIRIAWNGVAAASEYLVEFAEDEGFERLLARHQVDWQAGTLPPLARDGRYFWRVASIDQRGLRGRYSTPAVLEHDVYIEQSRAALQRLDADAALSSLSKSLEGLGPEIDALRERGESSLAAGDLDAARSTLATVLGLRPDDHRARNGIAEVDFIALDYDAAEAHYARVTEQGTTQQADHAWVGIALIRVRQGRFDDGLALTDRVLEHDPVHVPALNVAAMASIGLGDRAAAARFVRRALEQAPRDPTAASLALSLEDAPPLPGAGS